MKVLLSLLSAFVVFSSCVNAKKDEHLKQLNTLLLQMNEIDGQLESISIQNTEAKLATVSSNLKQIEVNYKGDTLDVFFAQTVSSYKVIQQQLQQIIAKNVELRKAIDLEKRQLSFLRKDMLNDAGKREKYDYFLQSERQNVAQLKQTFKAYSFVFSSTNKSYQTSTPKILEIIQRMQQK